MFDFCLFGYLYREYSYIYMRRNIHFLSDLLRLCFCFFCRAKFLNGSPMFLRSLQACLLQIINTANLKCYEVSIESLLKHLFLYLFNALLISMVSCNHQASSDFKSSFRLHFSWIKHFGWLWGERCHYSSPAGSLQMQVSATSQMNVSYLYSIVPRLPAFLVCVCVCVWDCTDCISKSTPSTLNQGGCGSLPTHCFRLFNWSIYCQWWWVLILYCIILPQVDFLFLLWHMFNQTRCTLPLWKPFSNCCYYVIFVVCAKVFSYIFFRSVRNI
jgi:hypothetical protein